MGLVPSPPGRVEAEAVLFEGRDVLRLSADERRRLRGGKMSMIFQEPMTSLNPVHTVGQQIVEAILAHTTLSPQDAKQRAIEMLELVRIPSAAQRIDDYPFRLSGGMRQRVMIAMALCSTQALIAEPTTALDVTVQAQILDLMRALRDETGAAIMLITHDLGVIAELAQDVIVMYAGKIVERADVVALFADPQHPYTVGLLGSIPKLHADQQQLAVHHRRSRAEPAGLPRGCRRFSPRCNLRIDKCRVDEPGLAEVKPDTSAALLARRSRSMCCDRAGQAFRIRRRSRGPRGRCCASRVGQAFRRQNRLLPGRRRCAVRQSTASTSRWRL